MPMQPALWSRACRQATREWLHLDVATLLACGAVQYLHGVCAQAARFTHSPAVALSDLGFLLVPEWGTAAGWRFSEHCTVALFCALGGLLALPFVLREAGYLAGAALKRVLLVVSTCQLLRCASFLVTRLPSPAPHCRPGASVAERRPADLSSWMWVDVARQSTRGCGDLIFSSHVCWGMAVALSVHRYGRSRRATAAAAALLGLQAFGILAARKHYSVDVVVAWYTTPLVWAAWAGRLKDPVEEERLPL